jgi:hypothetical protein
VKMSRLKTTLRMLMLGRFLSPPGLLLRAGILLAAFGAFHLLGWRDDTRVLSGTSAPSEGAVARGMLYAAAYFSAVLLCPILILAAAIQMVMQRAIAAVKKRKIMTTLISL